MAVATNISIIMLIYILIMVIATIFVYKDAKKRNMNGGMWAIIAFFGPFLIGVIIYLVCRNPVTDLQCAKCGESINKEAKNCPKCGTALLVNCPECQFPVQKGWQSCPKCGTRFPENYSQPIKTYKKESGIGIILLIVMLAVVCILFIGYALFAGVNYSYTGYGYDGMQVGEYNISETDFSSNTVISKWIDESKDAKEKIHVLYSRKSKACIVYVKDSDYLLESKYFELNYVPNGAECIIDIKETGYEDLYGYDFYYYEFLFEFEEDDEKVEFKVHLNGEEKKIKLTETKEDISIDSWEVE